ncbi:MAG TPA: hypothetical protein VL200_09415 [Lacunisphaera sp.]|jgi:hypothetical protein|nr:hypothetical protein [Lacunisphaera sp.]
MKPARRLRLVALAGLLLLPAAGPVAAADAPKAESATAIALRKIADRYALTKSRIASLLDQRLHPTPLPAKLPNPFYRVPEAPVGDNGPTLSPDTAAVPAAPDLSDADVLAKFAAGVKISGYLEIGGSARLTINSTLCRTGDVIPYGPRDRQVFIQVQKITPDEVTLKLNDATQTVRLRK